MSTEYTESAENCRAFLAYAMSDADEAKRELQTAYQYATTSLVRSQLDRASAALAEAWSLMRLIQP